LTKKVYHKRNVVGSQDTIFDSLSIILCIIYVAVVNRGHWRKGTQW